MAKSLSKQDRQGVRTPTNLEQKYRFGNEQRSNDDMRASFVRTVSDIRAQMASIISRVAALEHRFVFEPVISTDAGLKLDGIAYDEIKAAWDDWHIIVLYIDQADKTRRYYHCMGTVIVGEVTGLAFLYCSGTAAERIFLGSDNTITVTPMTLTVQEVSA